MKAVLRRLRDRQPVIMGILNVTPDSFSDGGRFNRVDRAVEHALAMLDDGADIIDVGGESTRPGAVAVSADEEIDRVVPVIEAIRRHSAIPVSIDTSKPEVMRAAVRAGADMINDVNALQADGALETCAGFDLPVCLMHRQGLPQTMQDNPHYDHVLDEVYGFLESAVARCVAAGIDRGKLIVDPGFGFGKRLEDNLTLLANLDRFDGLQCPLLVGVSRKSMFGMLLDLPVEQRMCSSVVAVALAYQRGAHFFRVHDVRETRDAIRLCMADRRHRLSWNTDRLLTDRRE